MTNNLVELKLLVVCFLFLGYFSVATTILPNPVERVETIEEEKYGTYNSPKISVPHGEIYAHRQNNTTKLMLFDSKNIRNVLIITNNTTIRKEVKNSYVVNSTGNISVYLVNDNLTVQAI